MMGRVCRLKDIWLKKPLEFFFFFLYPWKFRIPDKTKLYPWKFHKIALDPFQIPLLNTLSYT